MTATAGRDEKTPDRIDPALEEAEWFHNLMASSSFGADAVRQDELCGSRLLAKFDPVETNEAAEGHDFAARLHDELGQRFEEKGMTEDAELNYRAALRVKPENRPGVAIRLAILLEKGGDRDGALEWYVISATKSQAVNNATHHLATICSDVGDEQVADILLTLGHSHISPSLSRSLVRYQQASPRRRVKIAHNDPDAESLYFVACHFHVAGEYESAYVCYREAFVRHHRMAAFGIRSLSRLSDGRAKALGPWMSAKEELESPAAAWANEQRRRLVDRAYREPLVPMIDTLEPSDNLEPLISQAVQGNRRSLNRVLEVIRPLVVRYCRARIGHVDRSYASADDIAQDVLLAVLTALPRYHEQGRQFLAFVYGIAAHKVVNAHRAVTRERVEPVAEVPDTLDLRDGPEQQALNGELSKKIGKLLDTLPAKQREILVLRVVVGLSAEQTAEAIQMTAGAVRVAQHRALSKLRNSLADAAFSEETGEMHVDHKVLARHAADKVNVPSDEVKKRRTQVNHLRQQLEAHIDDHPDCNLVKLRASGSTAKGTAIRRRAGEESDADVTAYVRASSVGGVDVPESGLLEWLKDRCVEVYGKTKVADDFVISDHAVGITLRGTGLKIDVAPVLYEDEPDDKGFLVTRQGDRVLTSVTLHLQFIQIRKREAGRGYAELIRLLKAWIRQAKRIDPDLRCKSLLLELLVAHLWAAGWHGETLAVNDYPRAFEQVLSYIANTGLQTPISFADFYGAGELVPSCDPIQIWDPVNPSNNIARSYTDADRKRLVDCAADSLEDVSWAALAPTKGAANEAWRKLLGPSFEGA